MIGSGLKCDTGMVKIPVPGGETLLLLFVLPLRVSGLKVMGVNVLLEEEEAPLLWSELLERDLPEPFFFSFSIAVDFERGLPTLGISSAAIRFALGRPSSLENLLSRRAIGEGELDKLPPGETRPLCLSRAFQKGLELLKL